MSQDCVKISVRNLVEFMLRSGNIEAGTGYTDVDTMQEGARLHRKIQKKMGSFYTPEVPLQTEIPLILFFISMPHDVSHICPQPVTSTA